MKIEKLNDNQIRCTLSREDLDERQLKISEIAYGSEKAKALFRDMMQQASYECGFEAEDIPLMIEAIPMNTGSIVFLITKVEDPEELDVHFSRFAPSIHDDYDNEEDSGEYADPEQDNEPDAPSSNPKEEFLNLFNKLKSQATELRDKAKQYDTDIKHSPKETKITPVKFYAFSDFDALISACKVADKFYKGDSTLYKNPMDSNYYLLLRKGYCDDKNFIKICNILIEYGSPRNATSASVAFADEHFDVLVEDKAIHAMSQI